MKWQPIETAPHDGTIFLAANAKHHWIGWMMTFGDLDNWKFVSSNRVRPATHWMPLPKGPKFGYD